MRRDRRAAARLASAVVAALYGWLLCCQREAWLHPSRGSRSSRTALRAVQPLTTERTALYMKCVEEFDPSDPEDFDPGPPATGFRNMTEAIRPYHQNPEWMIWPNPGFARDQKIASMYTLVAKICKPDGRKCRPFIGKVLRGLEVPEADVKELADLYKEGVEFTWPGFTACQLESSGLWPFDGNLNFEIECNIDPAKLKSKEVFAPVGIKRFLGDSNEVLFPPHTRFRVVGEKPKERVTENEVTRDVYTKILEVVELPTPMN